MVAEVLSVRAGAQASPSFQLWRAEWLGVGALWAGGFGWYCASASEQCFSDAEAHEHMGTCSCAAASYICIPVWQDEMEGCGNLACVHWARRGSRSR